MDSNKREKLIEIGYVIKACGTCTYANIKPKLEWGTCNFHSYKHEKHSLTERDLSINRHGCCNEYVVNASEARFMLGGFTEFAK